MVSPVPNDALARSIRRRDSVSQESENSQTAADYILEQTQLEADAREVLPYSIDNCTKPLGPLRQQAFACMTCTSPPKTPDDESIFHPAGICYACSVQCHGEHELVEIFNKRNFTCDCGTTRLPLTSPCALRLNAETGTKGGVHSEAPAESNTYNQNFKNRFCSCSVDYNPHEQNGTMFQCLGLGTVKDGGCGEDWYHPGCLVGLGANWREKVAVAPAKEEAVVTESADAAQDGSLGTIQEEVEDAAVNSESGPIPAPEADDEDAMPPGFPAEDDFDTLICWKCVEANPWIKRYAGTTGFLPPVYVEPQGEQKAADKVETPLEVPSKKRKAADDLDQEEAKKAKSDAETSQPSSESTLVDASTTQATSTQLSDTSIPILKSTTCLLTSRPPPSQPSTTTNNPFSLLCTPSFRTHLCHCPSCFPHLTPHPQLLEEEETYEPSLSSDTSSTHHNANDSASVHSGGSLYDRGESALRNMDRVKAIEGVMAYNHLKEQLTPFFKQFAESGKAVGAEDIKAYFAKLRGDEDGVERAREGMGSGGGEENHRREQGGY